MESFSVAVIGGGASGIMAAISAAEFFFDNFIFNKKVVVLERLSKIGRKILATGNGRCNISNVNAGLSFYHGNDVSFIGHALDVFGPTESMEFFEKIGALCKVEDDGCVYPFCEQSAGVLDVLRGELDRLSVVVKCNFDTITIDKVGKWFVVSSKSGEVIRTQRVIVSTGGSASPALGSNGSGYTLLSTFGHNITPVYPALVQIKTSSSFPRALSGVKFNGTASLIVDSKVRSVQSGEILFKDFGLSGIPVLGLARFVGQYLELLKRGRLKISLDLIPSFSQDELASFIYKRSTCLYYKSLEDFFTGFINKKLGQSVLKAAGVAPLSRAVSSLSDYELKGIITLLKNWNFTITGTLSWSSAQVTAGGIDVSHISPISMESLLVKGLYVTGELLDIDGDCGGFNLQWAWSSGFIAGRSAAASVGG